MTTNDVEYRYFLTDLMSNEIIAEVPFKAVSYERANKRAGSFSGTIPAIEATVGLNLYESTMPGRSGIYIMRNGVCVWGGIIWSRSYDVSSREISVNGSEFMSYYYKRHIWQTLQYGSNFVGVFSYQTSDGLATITTEIPHGFAEGDKVRITFTSPSVDGVHTISNIPAANQFEFETTYADTSGTSTSGAVRSLVDTFDFARDIIFRVNSDLSGIGFANEFIKPGIEIQASVISKERSGNIVTIRTDEPHGLILGQEFELDEVDLNLDGLYVVSEIPNETTFRFEALGSDIPPTSLPGIRELNVVSKSLIANVATIVLDKPHGASVGQTVFLDGVDAFFTGIIDRTFNGRFTIIDVPDPNSFSFSSGGILDVAPEAVAGGLAKFGSKAIYGTYGSYIANSDLGIRFENLDKSGYYHDTQVIRGFEQKTAGQILEDYSNSLDAGFDYRIDCDYSYDTASFTRTFKIIPIELDSLPASGQYYEPKDFGADRLVFEYPGNISKFTIEESAEDAATRFWTVGRLEGLSGDSSQPYAGEAAIELLENLDGRSWPIIDQVEQLDGIGDEIELHRYASDYLFEAQPPMGTYTVSVNGSMDPIAGSYFPGDWCSLILQDEFVAERLESDQEPREDVLVRKIESYSVRVPDNPAFPEEVELRLISDWKVDQRGQ